MATAEHWSHHTHLLSHGPAWLSSWANWQNGKGRGKMADRGCNDPKNDGFQKIETRSLLLISWQLSVRELAKLSPLWCT